MSVGIQDFKPGDSRFTNGVKPFAAASVEVNRTSRGLQFGTRYYFNTIENGGYWSTDSKKGQVKFAGSWEENALMLAEANIRSNAIETGLGYIDQVRAATGANLPVTVGTGLSLTQALEELRSERRVALALRGLAFYDARRWNITAKASAGGGRANANVIVPNSMIGATPAGGWTLLPCFMEYNYLDYFDVPVTEFSYNVPAPGGPAIAN
ncbi:RagB/SusD family nutrient uptake outer membrane protein [Pedobacter sp. UC225_65]|uniref:RagB/SusD family nutrient uptake outer membrane protein n=1 Tax=Pedobacter sp. UC225_65 TaxID=3350173 RepID=UPI00366D7849